MEAVRDPYLQYSDLLNKAFEKIKKTVPKKYNELKNLCTEAQGKLLASPCLISWCRKNQAGKRRAI